LSPNVNEQHKNNSSDSCCLDSSVGTVAAAGNDHMAFAYKKDKNAKYGGDNGIGDGSTVIIKKLKVKEQLSGFLCVNITIKIILQDEQIGA
jgi:hypothetical protein